MAKFFVSLVFLVFFISKKQAVAQREDQRLFQTICTEIEQQNRNFLIQKSIESTGTKLLYVPASGEQIIEYGTLTRKVQDFKKFSPKIQLEILNAKQLPNFPLMDSIYIIDSTGFFAEEIACTVNNHFFKTVKTVQNTKNVSFMRIYAIAVREDQLLFSFSYFENTLLSNYHLKFQATSFKVVKTTTVDPADPHWKRR